MGHARGGAPTGLVRFGRVAPVDRGGALVRVGVMLAVAGVIGLLALLGYTLVTTGDRVGANGTRVNSVGSAIGLRERPAAPFTLRLLDGGTFRLGDVPAALTIVNFWASWCPPCRDEAPALEALHQAYRGRGVVLIGFDLWDREDDARKFVRDFGLTYPNGIATDSSAAVDYGVRGIPETFAIDARGQLIRRWIGPLTESQGAELIEGALR